MAECRYHHDIPSLSGDIVTQVPQFRTGSDEVIQEDVVGTSRHLALETHPSPQTCHVRGIGM